MRKAYWIILAVLFLAIRVPNLNAQVYDVSFTCTAASCVAPTAPPVSFPSPTIDVTYPGLGTPFDLSLSLVPGWMPSDSYTWFERETGGPPYNYTFTLEDTTQASEIFLGQAGFASPQPAADDQGSVRFTVVTPEPSSLVLMLSGVGLLGLMMAMRKR
jgi:PEP-CTERM motif